MSTLRSIAFALFLIPEREVWQRLHPQRRQALIWFFALCAIFHFAGCSTVHKGPTVMYSPPSVQPVRENVQKASAAVTATKSSVSSAKANVNAAQDEARVIIGELPDDLKPKVTELQMRLTMALRDLDEAEAKANEAQLALQKSDEQVALLQKRIDDETDTLNAANAAKDVALDQLTKANGKLAVADKKLLHWRLLAGGLVAGALALGALKLGLFKLPFLAGL